MAEEWVRSVGVVRWFDETKKHGAITPLGEDAEEISFYLDDDDDRTLGEGEVVEFTKERTPIGTRAKDIVILPEVKK